MEIREQTNFNNRVENGLLVLGAFAQKNNQFSDKKILLYQNMEMNMLRTENNKNPSD